MAQSLDLYIDTTTGALISSGSASDQALPTLTRNDSYNLRVRLRERDQSTILRDLDLTGITLKLGIGEIDDQPSAGGFKLAINGVTSSVIPFDATAVCVYNAISNNVSTVALYGSSVFGGYLLTATQPNTAMSFSSDSFTLFPTSSVLISTRRFPAPSVEAQQTIRLNRSPAVFADTFVVASTANVVSLSKIQDGSTSQNETYDLSVGRDAEGGSVILNYGTNSTTAIAVGASAASFSEALSAVTGIGSGNISVDLGNNGGRYLISFVRNLGSQNITTALTLDPSGVVYAKFLTTTLTMATSELNELFAESTDEVISPNLEIELSQDGSTKTILQREVSIRRSLIDAGASVPASQASYLTAVESYATFVRNWGSAVTAQSNNINVVSALINVGIVANGATYGVLPQSIDTLTLLTSVTFGTLAGNDQHYRDVVVTGAAVNDIVLLGLPSAVSGGVVIQGVVYKANTVCLSCVNSDSVSRSVNTATYRITVIGY